MGSIHSQLIAGSHQRRNKAGIRTHTILYLLDTSSKSVPSVVDQAAATEVCILQ